MADGQVVNVVNFVVLLFEILNLNFFSFKMCENSWYVFIVSLAGGHTDGHTDTHKPFT